MMHDGACAGGDASAGSIRVERMEVRRGHLVCRVAFGAAPRTTSPQLMSRVLDVVPTLAQHACVNERGTTFAAVMDCTPLPHLLEHLVVDLQVRAESGRWGTLPGAMPGAPPSVTGSTRERPIVGTSEWLDEAAGIARIDVSFADDLVALRAMRDSVAFLNKLLRG
ncbi:hypothetical protein [uncultured Senegalimassilia sp.]|uniref:cyanophycin synthetase family protein n=1 Tax=uncultured Senegalimassilia sp. TaxID=1714350 RepID=UPI0025D27F79|nr:hypothetical protein [uncultured Senegalimassilia sp.]